MNLKVLLALIGAVIVAVAMFFTNTDSNMIPEALQGRWITDEPRYEVCYLDLTTDFVDIGTRQGNSRSGVVLDIQKDIEKRSSRYTITYLDDVGDEFVLVLHYEPTEGGVVRLENQTNILWWREDDTPT